MHSSLIIQVEGVLINLRKALDKFKGKVIILMGPLHWLGRASQVLMLTKLYSDIFILLLCMLL
jgi:hypothetical protein